MPDDPTFPDSFRAGSRGDCWHLGLTLFGTLRQQPAFNGNAGNSLRAASAGGV
jgi:hypothetical protein